MVGQQLGRSFVVVIPFFQHHTNVLLSSFFDCFDLSGSREENKSVIECLAFPFLYICSRTNNFSNEGEIHGK